MMVSTDVRMLLADVAALINEQGPDSPVVLAFIEQHRDNAEFVELAQLSQALKRVLASPRPKNGSGIRKHSG